MKKIPLWMLAAGLYFLSRGGSAAPAVKWQPIMSAGKAVTAAVTNGSNVATFSVPQVLPAGTKLVFDASNVYRVKSYAGTAVTLDKAFTGTTTAVSPVSIQA